MYIVCWSNKWTFWFWFFWFCIVVNLEMSSTASFFCRNAIYGCSGLGNCRMLNFLSIAFCVIDLISMLIRWTHSITNIFRINLFRYFVFVSMPTFSTVIIITIIIRQPLCPVVGRRPQHVVSKLPCLVLSSVISCRSSICPGRLSTARLVSLVVFSCHMVSKWWRARSIGRLWGG